jgi:drug/metabolite transporter (DMT)-like permease
MQESHGFPNIVAPPAAARFAFAAVMLGNVLLAFGPWLVRLADVGPIASGFWRLALAAPLLILLGRAARQPFPKLNRGIWIMLAAGGLFFAADLASWHVGILHTRLANATLFGNITSFTFAAYGFLVARQWPGRNQSFAILLALVGVIVLLGRSYELSPGNMMGDLFCILAGLFYTGYLIAVARTRDVMAPLPALAAVTLAGIVPLLLFALLLGETILPQNWTPLILLAIGSQVIGQGLMVFAVAHLAPVVVGLSLLVQPIVAAAIGWTVYGERLGPADWAGAIALGVAMVLVRRPDRQPPALA